LRAFIALEVPGQVLDSLVAFQDEIRATGADVKLVEKENLHFTLKFLGEITEAQVAEAKSKLQGLALKGAEVVVRGAGAFPSLSQPRVVWAGVGPEHEALIQPIADAVISSLKGIGERDDRPFRAHITLGRVRSGKNSRQLAELLAKNHDRVFGTVRLTALKLKSSMLTPSGPIYKDLGEYPLS
jgi:RNA 2',3'-cyclic 3'-phosphodiesterase